MPIAVTIRDESSITGTTDTLKLTFPSSVITVEELIKRRVDREVRDRSRTRVSAQFSPVRVSAEETILNIGRPRRSAKKPLLVREKKKVSAAEPTIEERYQIALKGFYSNAFFILVGDRQVRELDERIQLAKDTDIRFIKLVPLIGG
ncbi:MAG: hypothetical protein AAB416_04050 [Patescibacteria group bacterium]